MRHVLIALGVLVSTGCATILQPGPDKVRVNSEPEGARVFLDGMQEGVTPMSLSINRKDEGIIELRMDGYDSVIIDRDKVVAGWVFGNILLGGVIGLGVDLITHNQGKYSEDPIFMKLSPKSTKAAN